MVLNDVLLGDLDLVEMDCGGKKRMKDEGFGKKL